jgi:hypothetical protein
VIDTLYLKRSQGFPIDSEGAKISERPLDWLLNKKGKAPCFVNVNVAMDIVYSGSTSSDNLSSTRRVCFHSLDSSTD